MPFEYFFVGEWEAPEEYLWSLYGPGHLTWLMAIALVCFFACRAFKRAPGEKQDKALKGIAIWIFVQEIIKDLVFLWTGRFTWEHLPLHICGISIFFTLWYAFKPGRVNGAYIYGMSLPGALAALIFANWTGYPILSFSSINSFTIHGELVLFALMVLISGRLLPDIKAIPRLALIIYTLAIPIYFLNKSLGTNFMFINTPSPGSPLVPLYGVFGDYYVLAAAVLLIPIWVFMFLPWTKKEMVAPSPRVDV